MPLLHRLYQACGLLSALALVAICGLILAQIVARSLGGMVRDAEELAAWSMAAAGFLGLPYALHHGAHIRVEVVTRFMPKALRRPAELVSTGVALALSVYLAWYIALFVFDSWRFNEVSQGLVPVPMWIPQLPMVLGAVVLAIGFAERLWCVWRGRPFEVADADAAPVE